MNRRRSEGRAEQGSGFAERQGEKARVCGIKRILFLVVCLAATMTFASCDKDDDGPGDETGENTFTLTNGPGAGSEVYVTDYTLSADTELADVVADNIAHGTIKSDNTCDFSQWKGSNTGTFNVLVKSSGDTRAGDAVVKFKNGVQFSDGTAALNWNDMTTIVAGVDAGYADILSFSFTGIVGEATIDPDELTVTAEAKETVDLTNLVAEFTLSTSATVTVDGIPQVSKTTANDFNDPVIYKVTSGDGKTILDWTVTITKPLPVDKKYITYNKPVKAYYIEYDGGAIASNAHTSAGNSGIIIEAYEDKKYAHVEWMYDEWYCNVLNINTKGYFTWNQWRNDGPNVWMEWDDQAGSEGWDNGRWQKAEYPLDRFAYCVSRRVLGNGFLWMNPGGLNDLADVAAHPETATMPDNTDVTQYYIRSEKVCDIMCDVYKISTVTFWVDPDTGFTLKLDGRNDDGTLDEYYSYEVTRLVVGPPDWNGEHLHYNPADGDEYLRP